jgi:hypothetical protein
MTDVGSFGVPELIVVDSTVRIWVTPVALLGPWLFVSLLIEGTDPHGWMEPEGRPRVELSATGQTGGWEPCPGNGGGGGGFHPMAYYATFSRPTSAAITNVRLSVRFGGSVVTRELSRNP